MKVAVIILNYNSSNDCRKCVSFLKRQEGVELELILVDNCSSDGENVKKLSLEQGCTFIASSENRGYNAGNNIGLRYAVKQGYKYALITNPDMEFPQMDYILRLVNVMEQNDEIAVCGSNIKGIDGKRQSPRRFTSYWSELFWFLSGVKRKINKSSLILEPKNQYCDILMGSCIFVRLNFIEKIDYFDENIFLFCEEPILGKQVRAAGMKMYYFHEATAIHAHIESHKGSFKNRHKIYMKSRWYYLSNYSGYSRMQLIFMWIAKKTHYHFKQIVFTINGIK